MFFSTAQQRMYKANLLPCSNAVLFYYGQKSICSCTHLKHTDIEQCYLLPGD